MFCYKCGKQLHDDAGFCSYCGTKVNNIEPGTPPKKTDKRETSVEQVKNLLNYFSQKSATYNEFDKVTSMLDKFRNGRKRILKLLSNIFLVIGGILLLLSVVSIILSMISKSNNSVGLYGGNMWAMLFIYCINFLCPGIVLFIVDRAQNKKYLHNLDFYSNRYFELTDELYLNYLNYENCPIEAQYTNPNNIFVIQKTLMSGQADSVEEAVTLLSNNADKRIKAYSEKCASFAKKTAVQSGRTKTASKLNAVFYPGNYFTGR